MNDPSEGIIFSYSKIAIVDFAFSFIVDW
jgi:hypothetical protein